LEIELGVGVEVEVELYILLKKHSSWKYTQISETGIPNVE